MRIRPHLLAVALAMVMAGGAYAAVSADMSVQIRNAQLRATPSYLGKVSGNVPYAQRVQIMQVQGDWFEVRSGTATGWLHKSALTTKKIAAKSGAADVGATASGEELALAGKGFNADVEADFKKKNAKIDFGPIDRMEKIKVSPGDARAFLEQGGVKAATGGAR
ncbi:MAG: SH3 domain-containing protein [Lentisphaerae bacterium]|nr:SH3 domain-containing protein [Lentisphaerota bacterium]